ncbi:MAG: hypothetical protein ACOVPA_14530 [Rubrivivax sp.]
MNAPASPAEAQAIRLDGYVQKYMAKGIPTPEDVAQAIRLAELRAEAALRAETLPQAALRRCRDAVDAGRATERSIASTTWRALSLDLRRVLVALCTDARDMDNAANAAWHSFSVDERRRMGAVARDWRRNLERAGWLR